MGQTPKPIDTGIVVGQVFLGKYRVDAILGHGGMGVVAQCTHLQLQDRVAIKMLRPDVLADDDAVQRFLREAQAAVKLKSEYVAKVTDVGAFENGVPYMVMEYLDGQDLGQLLAERRHLPVPWVAELILQASEALSEAHALGIVHRDVKPTNLFVTWRPDGSALVKVLDFGISKSPIGNDMQLTQTQSLLGTPAYMSPEQMRSARMVDLRSDIWSLGTVLYEAIEGRRPFEAESFSEMCVKVAMDPPLQMHNAPPALQPIILRCLAKQPEQRYANMAELGRDLLPFSQDPQGGQIMVERMERMVRRSSGDWADSSSVASRAPLPLRDARSAPMNVATPTPPPGQLAHVGLGQLQMPPGMSPSMLPGDSHPSAAQWAGGSQPAAQAWAGGTDPTANVRHHAAAPPPQLTMKVAATEPRRNGLFIAVLAVAALAGIAIGVAFAMSGESAPPVAPKRPAVAPVAAPTPTPTPTPTPPEPVHAVAPSPTPPVPIEPTPAPVEPLPVEPTPVQAAPTPVEPPPTPTPTPAVPTAHRPHPTPTPRPVDVKPDPTPPTPPSGKPKCDPYATSHGCS